MDQSLSWEADSWPTGQQIPCLLCSLKVHYHVPKSSSLDSVLNWLNLVNSLIPCLFFNSILPCHIQINLSIVLLLSIHILNRLAITVGYPVQLCGSSVILTEVFCGFCQAIQAYAGIVPSNWPWPLLFPSPYVPIIHDHLPISFKLYNLCCSNSVIK
jgi:hypothetical protein